MCVELYRPLCFNTPFAGNVFGGGSNLPLRARFCASREQQLLQCTNPQMTPNCQTNSPTCTIYCENIGLECMKLCLITLNTHTHTHLCVRCWGIFVESSGFCGGVYEAKKGSHCQEKLLWLQVKPGMLQ